MPPARPAQPWTYLASALDSVGLSPTLHSCGEGAAAASSASCSDIARRATEASRFPLATDQLGVDSGFMNGANRLCFGPSAYPMSWAGQAQMEPGRRHVARVPTRLLGLGLALSRPVAVSCPEHRGMPDSKMYVHQIRFASGFLPPSVPE